MHHFQCGPCRLRLTTGGEQPSDLCPGCGAEFQPVEKLTEIVGFAAIAPSEAVTHEEAVEIIDRVMAASLPIPPI